MSWQQQLVAPEPTRRLRTAHPWWWGVDPSTQRVSVAWTQHNAHGLVRTVSFADVRGAQRLSVIYAEVRGLAAELAGVVPPGIVVVEQPSGSKPNLELVYAVGAAIAGLYDGVCGVVGPQHFETVTSGHWKKALLGYGAIRKPSPKDVRAGAQYPVLEWARATQNYEGSLWDEADALAIAAWARQDVLLET